MKTNIEFEFLPWFIGVGIAFSKLWKGVSVSFIIPFLLINFELNWD